MINKGSLIFVLSVFSVLAIGCGTAGGLGKGIVTGAYVTAVGTGKGVAKGMYNDAHGLTKAITVTDNWIKENLW